MNRKRLVILAIVAAFFALLPATAKAGQMPKDKEYTNSVGMKFVRVEPGKFEMGVGKTPLPTDLLPVFRGRGLFDSLYEGDYDEKPIHKVKITKPFYVGVFEVTNYQYELFDQEHKKFRGEGGSRTTKSGKKIKGVEGYSIKDNEAVTYVNWYDAQAFCQWLSDKEGIPYRLPTEAEWEYACRAGTMTHYSTGDVLTEEFFIGTKDKGSGEKSKSLVVGRTPANAWGIHDMHGNVEEWCQDWYGPYKKGLQFDPTGYDKGQFRVTRGGANGSEVYYLRSGNRLAAMPQSRNWLTGFRVVIGEMPKTKPLAAKPFENQKNVVDRPRDLVSKDPYPGKPYFKGPMKYVNMPHGIDGPIYACHNHDPAIAECPNGDLLAIWYTCHDEHGRELALAASRLQWGSDEWDQASLFFYVPDRNNHAPSLWFDDDKTMYHFSGVSAAKSRGLSVTAMRTSDDSGATWSAPSMVQHEFKRGHLPSEPVFRMDDGTIVFSIDGPDTL
ncbi:MAG: formylglycine-generating enzyme family protein, partial [Planctomycetota bacterium]